MKIFSAQLKGTTTVATGSNVSLTGSFSGSIAGIDINSTNTFTASLVGTNTFTSSIAGINTFTASLIDTNTFTSSTSARLNSIETISASNIARINSLETTSASVDTTNTIQNTRLSNLEEKTGSLASTGSNTFYGTQTITGSLYISSNLIVQGSSSLQNITASAVDIGTNKIILNVDNPAVRFAGISVYDSGSTQGTGSLWWDSTQNHWLYEHPSDSAAPYNSAILISGPKNTGSLGEETELVSNYVMKAVGGDHISASAIYDNGSVISLKSNTEITGSLSVMGDGGVLNRTTSGEPYLFFRKDGVNRGSIYGISGGGLRIFDQSDNQVLTITSSFVGIGTTNPFGTLHIANNTNTYVRIQATANNGSAELDLLANGGQNAYIDFGPNDLRFRSANSDMSSLNNSAVLSLTNGGRIGIGTTDPAFKFHISGSSQVTSYFQTSGTYAPITWTGDNGTTKGGVTAHNGYITIGQLNSGGTGVDGDRALTIISGSGFVGINTTSTNAPLTIKTSGDTQDGTFYSTLTINNTGTSTFSRVRFDRSGVARWGLTLANDDTFRISNLYENGSVTANDATFAIKNNNFVGIGTSNPSARLQIIGGNTAEGQLYVGNTDVNYSAGINFYTSTSNRGYVGWRHTSSGAPFSLTGIHLFNTDNSNIVFGTNNTVKAVINVDGNLGIGITNPAHKLSVNGNAKFIITPGASSDGDRITISQNNGTYGIDLVAYGSGANPYNSTQGIFSWGGYDLLVMSNNANIKFVTASYTERMRITNAGQILTYNQPAFMAYGNGNASLTPTTGDYLIFPSVHLNRGSHYNTSNGVFTAPVAGAYFFSWSTIGGNADDVYRLWLRINNTNFLGDYHLRLDTIATGSEYGTNGNRNAIVNLSANDTVRIFFRTDSTNTMYGQNDNGNSYWSFMGYLIG